MLKQNTKEVEEIDKKIRQEIKDGIIQNPTAQITYNDENIRWEKI